MPVETLEYLRQLKNDREAQRRNRELETIARERVQKDRDIAEARRKTATEVAEIRAKSAKDRLELDAIAEERKQAELNWKIARGQTQDAAQQRELDRKYAQKEKELSQRQLEAQQRVEHWNNQLAEKQYEFDNPSPAKLPEDRIETTDPVTGQKTVVHVPKGEIERRQAAKEASDEAQKKANESRNFWQKLRGVNLPVPPQEPAPAPQPETPKRTTPRPSPAVGMPVPGGASAPPFAVPPPINGTATNPPANPAPDMSPPNSSTATLPPPAAAPRFIVPPMPEATAAPAATGQPAKEKFWPGLGRVGGNFLTGFLGGLGVDVPGPRRFVPPMPATGGVPSATNQMVVPPLEAAAAIAGAMDEMRRRKSEAVQIPPPAPAFTEEPDDEQGSRLNLIPGGYSATPAPAAPSPGELIEAVNPAGKKVRIRKSQAEDAIAAGYTVP